MLLFILACQSSSPQQPEPLSDNVVVEMPKYEPLPWPKEGVLLKEPVNLEACLDRVPSCQCWMGTELKEECGPQYIYEILELPHLMSESMRQHTWTEECPTSLEDLRLLRMLHWTETGSVQWGEVVLTKRVVTEAAAIFQDLYLQRFPIHSLKPAVEYRGSDENSMADNNSSSFNCRKVKGSSRWSEHSFGEAIDINPLWNPWVKGDRIYPKNAGQFVSRATKIPGMINEGDLIVEIFEQHGWRWGSQKPGVKDYQHFSRADHEMVYEP